MARNRDATQQTAEPVIVTHDAVDFLTSKLNEISGLAFRRDAWENKAPDNYGVVEMNGESSNLWADDCQVAQVFQCSVHLYVGGGSDEWVAKVQEKLADSCDFYRLQAQEFAYDIGKNHWQWVCTIIGPIQWTTEEVVTDGTV